MVCCYLQSLMNTHCGIILNKTLTKSYGVLWLVKCNAKAIPITTHKLSKCAG